MRFDPTIAPELGRYDPAGQSGHGMSCPLYPDISLIRDALSGTHHRSVYANHSSLTRHNTCHSSVLSHPRLVRHTYVDTCKQRRVFIPDLTHTFSTPSVISTHPVLPSNHAKGVSSCVPPPLDIPKPPTLPSTTRAWSGREGRERGMHTHSIAMLSKMWAGSDVSSLSYSRRFLTRHNTRHSSVLSHPRLVRHTVCADTCEQRRGFIPDPTRHTHVLYTKSHDSPPQHTLGHIHV